MLGEIARGAVGVVYKALDPENQRTVAIKTLLRNNFDADDDSDTQLIRFQREAEAMSRLQHPGIVAVYETGEDGAVGYIVMEYIDGQSLKDILATKEALVPESAVRIMRSLLSALAYSHEHGIIHRDIKPANILIDRNGEAKLADFGVAKTESSTLTIAGTVLGTISYMSPEQLSGRPIDLRSDIFSAGAVFYELLTGQRPFLGTVATIELQVLNVEPHRPSSISSNCAPQFDQVVMKAMAKRPEDRYQSATAFIRAIEAAVSAMADDTLDDGSEAPTQVFQRPQPVEAEPQSRVSTTAQPTKAAWTEAITAKTPIQPSTLHRYPVIIVLMVTMFAVTLGATWWWSITLPVPPTSEPARPPQSPIAAPVPIIETTPPVTPEAALPLPLPSPALSPLPPPPAVSTKEAAITVLAALRAIECALFTVDVGSDDRLKISGTIGETISAKFIRDEIERTAPGVRYDLSVLTMVGRLCQPLNVIASQHALNRAVPKPVVLSTLRKDATLIDGEKLIVTVEAPQFIPFLQIDYFTLDGQVLHLLPNPLERDGRLPPSGRRTVGDPANNGRFWVVGAPFGVELIIVIASNQPLFARPHPEVEVAGKYLTDLAAALDKASPSTLATAMTIHSFPK
ncbi:MAG: serine/threonine-protein kinase [Rhodospirillaceae bacterium]